MSSVTNKQLLELVSESRLLSSVAIEGEVKLLDPMALDRCLSTGNGDIARIKPEHSFPNEWI